MIQINIYSFEFYAATVILIVTILVVFMLLQYAAIQRTLEDTNRALRIHGVIIENMLSHPNAPRWILEMDLPPELSADQGGVITN